MGWMEQQDSAAATLQDQAVRERDGQSWHCGAKPSSPRFCQPLRTLLGWAANQSCPDICPWVCDILFFPVNSKKKEKKKENTKIPPPNKARKRNGQRAGQSWRAACPGDGVVERVKEMRRLHEKWGCLFLRTDPEHGRELWLREGTERSARTKSSPIHQ